MAQRRALPEYAVLLRAAREDSGRPVTDIIAVLGISESTYRNAENGRGGPAVMNAIERVFPDEAPHIVAAWRQHTSSSAAADPIDQFTADKLLIPVELMHGLAEARVTRFHPSRKYYKLLREGRDTISAYVGQATETLEMVSINLATGMELERVIDTFEQMLVRRKPVRITVSLLDPQRDYLMESIAPVVSASALGLAAHIGDTIAALTEFRDERLSNKGKDLFQLWCHACIPNASAIVLDGDSEAGLIQLETKGYKMGMQKSYGFEASAPSDFFVDLRDSYRHLIRDGRKIF